MDGGGMKGVPMTAEPEIEDLQAVSHHVLTSIDQMRALEEEKRTVDPASPRFLALSDEIEALADEVRAVSSAETGLAREVAGRPGLPTVAEADDSRI
jgi:hypothetical protein